MTAPTASARSGVASWVLLRLTGLVLSVLVLGHFALTHIINDVAETDASYVAERMGSALYVTWDGAMLLAAVVHGAAGLWTITGEYAQSRRAPLRGVLVFVSAAMVLVGVATLVASR